MAEELQKYGLFVDEQHVLRVLEPNVAQETRDLNDESEIFSEKLLDFRKIVQEITVLLESFSKNVELVKMQAINSQNFLNSSAKQKELDQSQIQTKIIEKTLELDKLKVQVSYLQRVESEQLEVLDNYQNQ